MPLTSKEAPYMLNCAKTETQGMKASIELLIKAQWLIELNDRVGGARFSTLNECVPIARVEPPT